MHQTTYQTTAFAATISLVLTGCLHTQEPTEGTKSTATTCTIFSPIRWSEKDTRDTIRQAIGHNAAGKAVCGWQPPPRTAAKAKPKAKAPLPRPKPKPQNYES